MSTKRDSTPQAFLSWLKEAITSLSKLKEWPIGVTRFTYFDSEACWNLRPDLKDTYDPLTFSMEDFESSYKAAHELGDPRAIFEFAKDNREALKREWVVSQLVSWRLNPSTQTKKQFDKFMQAYWSQQGKRSHKNMLGIIKRDYQVYRDFVQKYSSESRKSALSKLSDEHRMSTDNTKDVLKFYGQFYTRWKTSRATRLYLSLKP